MMLVITKVHNCDFQEQVLVVLIDIRTIEKRKMKDYHAKKCPRSRNRDPEQIIPDPGGKKAPYPRSQIRKNTDSMLS
jgi:hypothetical protein